MPRPLPLFLNLDGQPVLLVGAGNVARAKLAQLLPTGAAITVVALSISEGVRSLAAEHPLQVLLEERAVAHADLAGRRLIVSATNDARLNAELARVARGQNTWFNAVDDPGRCDVTFAATFRRGPLHLAIGTDGAFPGLSGALRAFLEEAIPDEDADLLTTLADLRGRIRRDVPDPGLRARALGRVVEALKGDYFRAVSALAELS
jgi:precorrin-2 dehydrogenase/sirohydrochlorin ferrochelatase